LSGGQKQRVAIARALAGDPPILLADEPTAALDSTSGRTVIELLQRLARVEGRAVVTVTHDPRVLPFGDRIIHLEDGCILREERNVLTGPNQTSLFTGVPSPGPGTSHRVSI
jgi:putative ABC transport system ATP-binding protein